MDCNCGTFRRNPGGPRMAVILVGTLDTKGAEFRFVRDLLHQDGLETLVIDTGSLKPPVFPPDIARDEVFRAAGTTIEAIVRAADRGETVAAAARGVARLVLDLHARGQVDGV